MSWILLEYQCGHCGARIDSMEERTTPAETIPHLGCGGQASRTISAVKSLTVWGSVSRGAGSERPPTALDTRELAEGVRYSEWKEKRRAQRRDRRRAWVRSIVS